MKKIVLFLVILIAGAWGLQNYTGFKAVDIAKTYWQKIERSKISDFFGGKKDQTPDPEKQLNIFIRDGKFIPNLNAGRVGIKVTWMNEDVKTHTVTGEGWGSGEIAPGKAYSKTFDAAGDYKYQCSIYPSMTGGT